MNAFVEEKSFTGAQNTVRRIVAKLHGNPREAFVPLAFALGDAMQINWGEAVIYLTGERTTCIRARSSRRILYRLDRCVLVAGVFGEIRQSCLA